MMDDAIIATIRELERRYKTVYPYQVALAGVWLSERMVRYRMSRLVEDGRLVRMSDRSGYLTVERYMANREALVGQMAIRLKRRNGAPIGARLAEEKERAMGRVFYLPLGGGVWG